MAYDERFLFYWNAFYDSKGQDAAVVFPFSKWAWLDREPRLKKDYEAVFGEGSFDLFRSEFRACINAETEFIREEIK